MSSPLSTEERLAISTDSVGRLRNSGSVSVLYAFDLGSRTGVARFRNDDLRDVRPWSLVARRGEHPGARWNRLDRLLRELPAPDVVAYELVRGHRSTSARCRSCRSAAPRGWRSSVCPRCAGTIARRSTQNVLAAHFWGAAEAYLNAWCYSLGIVPVKIHTSDVKTAATGRGGGKGTSADDVLRRAEARWPTLVFDRDTAAAAFVGVAALNRCWTCQADEPVGEE